MRPASADDAARLLEAGGGLVRLMTLAPERDSGSTTIRFLVDSGVVVSAGHCDPDLDTLRRAIDDGLSMITHLGNGCPVMLPRHDNIINRVLSLSERLWICFIPDGAHIPDFVLRNYLAATGLSKVIFTSDAISAAGLGPGTYELSGEPVIVGADGIARRPGSENLAGSTIRGAGVVERLRENFRMNDADIRNTYGNNPRIALGIGG